MLFIVTEMKIGFNVTSKIEYLYLTLKEINTYKFPQSTGCVIINITAMDLKTCKLTFGCENMQYRKLKDRSYSDIYHYKNKYLKKLKK